jgi:ankyrin repeat protein
MVPMQLSAGVPADTRNKNGETPLFEAVRRGEPANVQALLAAGADPSARSNAGYSVLKVALDAGDSDVVSALRQRGAKEGPPPPGLRPRLSGPADRSPIDGVTLEKWARATGG